MISDSHALLIEFVGIAITLAVCGWQSQHTPSRRLRPSLRVLSIAVVLAVMTGDALVKMMGHGFHQFSPAVRTSFSLLKLVALCLLWWLTLRSKPTHSATA
jgi:hypothetical protein